MVNYLTQQDNPSTDIELIPLKKHSPECDYFENQEFGIFAGRINSLPNDYILDT